MFVIALMLTILSSIETGTQVFRGLYAIVGVAALAVFVSGNAALDRRLVVASLAAVFASDS
jgi:hypothetical protein